MTHRCFTLLALLTTMLAAGCSLAPVSPASTTNVRAKASTPGRCATPRRIVGILDRSGSYSSNGIAFRQLGDAIERGACPGDELFLRWLQDDSYGPGAQITSTVLVDVGPRPAPPSNPFEQRQYAAQVRRWAQTARQFQGQRTALAHFVRGLHPESAGASDVWGALHKADELLANTPTGSEPMMVLATDFKDNVDRIGPFALHGAAVRAIVYEADDPVEDRRRRQEWETRLLESGASSVLFRDVSESAVDILDSLSPATR